MRELQEYTQEVLHRIDAQTALKRKRQQSAVLCVPLLLVLLAAALLPWLLHRQNEASNLSGDPPYAEVPHSKEPFLSIETGSAHTDLSASPPDSAVLPEITVLREDGSLHSPDPQDSLMIWQILSASSEGTDGEPLDGMPDGEAIPGQAETELRFVLRFGTKQWRLRLMEEATVLDEESGATLALSEDDWSELLRLLNGAE